MNKFALIIFFTTLFCKTISAQQTFIPDDNFEQVLIDLGVDDTLDNYVLTSIIYSLAGIDLSSKNISDLTGIEDFEFLEYLDCSNNLLSELNLANNTFLKQLNCSSNNLSSIEISNNIELDQLNASNNLLSEIDISNNIDLSYFDCSSNELSNIDISNNTLLSFFYSNNNNANCITVWDVDFASLAETMCNNEGCFIKDDNAAWSIDCGSLNFESHNFTIPGLIKGYNILGKNIKSHTLSIEVYKNGFATKKLILNH